jgi:8-oxo-dGTP pyrophosphatase MutT (NUDIX family)
VSARPVGGRAGGIDPRERHRTAVVDGVAHYVTGAQVAILREGRILVQLRVWPPGWELPGGHSELGESPADTALREAREETGFEVRMIGIVGVYRWEGLRRTADAVYLAEVVGGEPRRSLESMSQRFVRRSRYPRAVFPWIPQRLEDAFDVAAGGPPVLRVQAVTMRHVLFFGSTLAGALVDEIRRFRRRVRRRLGR